MSSADGSLEAELGADACGSGSKLSDDSGIEDSWNDESSNMPTSANDRVNPGEVNSDTKTTPIIGKEPFPVSTPLTPPRDQELPFYGPLNIYASSSAESTVLDKNDVKDADAEIGVCGIENLGNTCFMNAGLQCIFAATSLQQLVINEKSLGPITNPENSQAVIRLVDRLLEMFMKVLSGEYKYLYPKDFHRSLAQVHSIFGDHKQHDCQEFVSFLLNGLHDALNRANPRKRGSKTLSSRESSPQMASLRLETSSESDNDDEETGEEVPKRMRLDNFDAEPDFGVECDEKLTPAQVAWRSYLEQNRSIIVDTFQGQFKSMVTCEKCHHVSNTYEPFMHVSVPIPHANEQQIVVYCRFMDRNSSFENSLQTQRFAVTVSKNATVGDVKNKLMKAMEGQQKVVEENFVMAEASNSFLKTTLVPDMGLQFLKLKENKQLYAIECQMFDGKDVDSSNENALNTAVSEGRLPKEGPTGWHTCGICLEDIFDDDLMVHNICGGVLCKDCLEATASYHSGQSFPCPVCNATVDEKIFCEMSTSAEVNKKQRTVLVPVLMRYSTQDSGEQGKETPILREKFHTFGHPTVLSCPFKMKTINMYEDIQKIMPNENGLDYSLVLTDSQGLSCSRCDTFSDCVGCKIEDEEEISFRPGDHVTIHFDNISQELVNQLSEITDDTSMASLRVGDAVNVSECFQYFCENEILSEDNPWFCPKCRRNQIATKSISVSRWPDVLIVHLKRFYFEGLQSAKVTSPVEFQSDSFNLDFVCCTEAMSKDNYVYDLIGIVCHTGSLTSGHYTSYCKHNSKWFLFNDEITCQVDLSAVKQENVYMLFYQKTVTGSLSSSVE